MSRRRRKSRRPIWPRTEPYGPVRHPIPTIEEAEAQQALQVYEKRLPGRPTMLTPHAEGMFLGLLMKGIYRNVAAEMCGLKPDTVEKWIRRGRGKIKERPPTAEYVLFVRRVEQAEAMARGKVESNIVDRSKHDHNAGLAWLRTRYPQQWPRFPGGVDEEQPDGPYPPFRAPTAPPMETTEPVRQQTNILVLDSEKWPELASMLIGQNRAEQDQRQSEEDAEVAAAAVEHEDASDGAPRHSRLDRLRSEE